MIPKELLRALRRIEITTRRLATEQLSGNYISGFKGQGLAFSDVRKYQPGYDVRTIDWNVTARTGEPFVKTYVEERELTVMLVCDVSQSQDFGSGARSKLEAAVELVNATRDPRGAGLPQLVPLLDNGASVRGSIALIKVAKAAALLGGRTYVSPHDVKSIAVDVLRHRILPSYEAEAQGKTADHLVAQILENVAVP